MAGELVACRYGSTACCSTGTRPSANGVGEPRSKARGESGSEDGENSGRSASSGLGAGAYAGEEDVGGEAR